MNDFRTPLSRVRGLGSAKSGVGHFIGQRVSAIALFILMPVFLFSLATHVSSLNEAYYFFASTWGALLTLLTATAAIYHMRLGLQVLIEDYISKHTSKALLLMTNTFIAMGCWLVIFYSLLRVAY